MLSHATVKVHGVCVCVCVCVSGRTAGEVWATQWTPARIPEQDQKTQNTPPHPFV